MDESLLPGLVAGIFIGGAAGYLGSLMLGRRMALVAGPLGHLTLPGVALALMFGFDVSLGAFPFVVLGVLLIWILEMRTKLPMEALTAIVFATGVAIAFLFLPLDRAEAALVGDISKARVGDTVGAVIASLGLVFWVNRAYPKLVLINVSEDLAASESIDVKRYNFFYLFAISVIVALGVRMVGGLLTAALVAIPPSAARNVSKNLRQYALGSMAIGASSSLVGIALSRLGSLPAGPLIVLVSASTFLVSLPFAR